MCTGGGMGVCDDVYEHYPRVSAQGISIIPTAVAHTAGHQ